MVSEQSVIDSCQQWVSTVVVGLNFCPFAKSVIEAKGLAYTVIDERDIARCLKIFCDELNNLAASESIETKLLIYPQGFESFDDYLELAALAEASEAYFYSVGENPASYEEVRKLLQSI